MENKTQQVPYAVEMVYWDDRIQVLNHCDTFAILDQRGDVSPLGKEMQGIYYRDTRFINRLEFKLNDKRCTLLSSAIKEENEVLSTDLTNSELRGCAGEVIAAETIHIRRSQFVRDNFFHEELEFTSFNAKTCSVDLVLALDGDFRDIFEVRGQRRQSRGALFPPAFPDDRTVILRYNGLDQVTRTSQISFLSPYKTDNESNRLLFPLTLFPSHSVKFEYSITFILGGGYSKRGRKYLDAWHELKPDILRTRSYFPVFHTSNEQFSHWINRSQTDLISLLADTSHGKFPYAGVPWYNTVFGRDALLTAMETLWMAPDLSRDVLLFLATHQSESTNVLTDAEPGKILHEMRGGEMAALNEVPFKKYYGTIDATPLFVWLAGAYYDRTADLATIRRIWPNVRNAVEWIDQYGDIDGDGFVEYSHKAANGLTNQGWKDSFDSISYQSGELCQAPVALCEVQAYTYAAKIHGAKLADVLGETALANRWEQQAKALKMQFNALFWDDHLTCYVLALDGNKRPCRVVSSNAGHTLFTGIADESKAAKLVETLMKPDMFTKWGIRTLSSKEVRYNPMSYHNGSVWPHDVALIARGMSAYGFTKQTVKLVTGLFDASLFLSMQRLPELFCGFERRSGQGPTAYPVACSPQAWSVGSVFMLLNALLQLTILSEKKEVRFVNPILPDYLNRIRISQLKVEDSMTEIDITKAGRANDRISIKWKNKPRGWNLTIIQ